MQTSSPCVEWLWTRSPGGYGQLGHRGRVVYAHRLAFCNSKGLNLAEITNKVVRHSCDNPGCVNPDHLSLGSHNDNVKDKVSRGRQARGSRNGGSTLTEGGVHQMRQAAGQKTQRELAKEFGVNQSTVQRILSKQAWGHL